MTVFKLLSFSLETCFTCCFFLFSVTLNTKLFDFSRKSSRRGEIDSTTSFMNPVSHPLVLLLLLSFLYTCTPLLEVAIYMQMNQNKLKLLDYQSLSMSSTSYKSLSPRACRLSSREWLLLMDRAPFQNTLAAPVISYSLLCFSRKYSVLSLYSDASSLSVGVNTGGDLCFAYYSRIAICCPSLLLRIAFLYPKRLVFGLPRCRIFAIV